MSYPQIVTTPSTPVSLAAHGKQANNLAGLILLNRIRSACLQMRFYQNDLDLVGIKLKSGAITPDEAQKILEDMGATPLLNAAVGLP